MAQDVSAQGARVDEDQPLPLALELPPQVQAPLARYEGRAPDAPEWFTKAVAQEPERRLIGEPGRRIELLTWGEVGRPGLLLVHGNSAHADWWSFIAPILAEDYRVAAMSLAGMGASDWRDSYSSADFAADADACAKAAGLNEGPVKPIYVGHSFGGSQTFYVAAMHPERMRAAVLVDVGFHSGPPADDAEHDARARRGSRVYPDMKSALARFRFLPPQAVENDYIADFIARRSLKPAPLPDGSGEGLTWRFDPAMWAKMNRQPLSQALERGSAGVTTPLAHILGEFSDIARRPGAEERSPLPPDAPRVILPDARHHVMVDQPLALVAALRTLLSVWPA